MSRNKSCGPKFAGCEKGIRISMDKLQEFLKLEEKHHMLEAKVFDVSYWMFLRKWIYNDILKQKENMRNVSIRKEHENENKFSVGFHLVFNSFFRHYSIPEKTDILISSHPRRILENGKYICTYTTPVTLAAENVLVMERPNPYLHKRPVPEKKILYVDRSILTSNLMYLFIKKIRKAQMRQMSQEIKCKLEPFLQDVREVFQLELKIDGYIKETIRHSILYSVKRKYYDRILKKTNPKVILEVVSYLPENMILNELAKQYHIPTIELQHGTISRKNISYTLMPGRIMPQLPDYFFAFSEFWKSMIPETIPREHIKVVGFPYFEGEINRIRKTSGYKNGKTICFISQWNVGEQLSRLAVELSQRLQGKDWKIYYKLHPAEYNTWKETYPWLCDSTVEVLGENDISLYEMFAKSDIQVGVGSTAIYEGLGFGVETFIYEIIEKNVFYDLCDKGYAKRFQDVDSLLAEMENGREKKEETKSYEMEFWAKDSLNNMLREIKAICGKE